MLKICTKLLVKQWKRTKQSFPKADQSDTQQLFFSFLFEWKAAAPLIKLLSMFLAPSIFRKDFDYASQLLVFLYLCFNDWTLTIKEINFDTN